METSLTRGGRHGKQGVMGDAGRKGSRAALLIVLAVFGAAFAYMTRLFWAPAGLAAVAVILCEPLYERVLAVCRGRRYLAATIGLVAVSAFILLPLSAILVAVVDGIIRFSHHAVEQLEGGALAARIDAMDQWLARGLSQLGGLAPTEINLRATLLTAAKLAGKTLYQFSPKVLASTAHVGVAALLWMLFVFVFFADGPRLYRFFAEISPLDVAHEALIAREVRGMVSAILFGMVAISAVNALLIAFIYWISPLNGPLEWGLITFGLSFIPVIGAFSVWAGGAVYLLLIGQTWWAAAVFAYGLIIISQSDNIVRPLVMRARVNIHPVLLLISLLGGLHVLGPAGLIFGPVFLAILLVCLRIYRREFV